MRMLIIFSFCTLLNVVLATIKSVMTIKGTKISAAIWNALSFGLYSYIVILTATADLTTAQKVVVTVLCNLIGVYGVKWVEEKMRKDKLWKFEITVPATNLDSMTHALMQIHVPFNYISNIGKYVIFNVYAMNQAQSCLIEQAAKANLGKAFATETKLAP